MDKKQWCCPAIRCYRRRVRKRVEGKSRLGEVKWKWLFYIRLHEMPGASGNDSSDFYLQDNRFRSEAAGVGHERCPLPLSPASHSLYQPHRRNL